MKYHLGYETEREINDNLVKIFLAPNPSHLEAVNPVVEGMARARQRIIGDAEERRRVLPILLHGDAAFAGQGAVAEVLNFSQLPGYRTGGTIHIVINNQIGFTTSNIQDSRGTNFLNEWFAVDLVLNADDAVVGVIAFKIETGEMQLSLFLIIW